MATQAITINRAPVLTLWAAVVAERLGFTSDEALSLGKALAGLNAQSKGRALGIFKPPALEKGERRAKRGFGEESWVDLCGRAVPAKNTSDGLRAVVKDKPIDAGPVRSYLERAFGDGLEATRDAMTALAQALEPNELAEQAFRLYERFRPKVESGARGWGQKGKLDLALIRRLADGS